MIENIFETTDNVCYNPVKQSENNMSYVIMMKCVDGVVCASDSKSTLTLDSTRKSGGDVKKVFSNGKLLIGTFGVNTVMTQSEKNGIIMKKHEKLESIINNILSSVENKEDFAIKFKEKISDDTNTFSFLIGCKESNVYSIFYFQISRDECVCNEINNGIASCNAQYTHNCVEISKSINVNKDAEIVKKMIESTEYLQSELLEYQNVAGEILQ